MYLTLNKITKVFPPRGNVAEVTAVNDINLEIAKGELGNLARTIRLWKDHNITYDCRI